MYCVTVVICENNFINVLMLTLFFNSKMKYILYIFDCYLRYFFYFTGPSQYSDDKSLLYNGHSSESLGLCY